MTAGAGGGIYLPYLLRLCLCLAVVRPCRSSSMRYSCATAVCYYCVLLLCATAVCYCCVLLLCATVLLLRVQALCCCATVLYRRQGLWSMVWSGGLSTVEETMQMAMWAMWNSPLIMSNDLPNIDSASKKLLLNREILAINQDVSYVSQSTPSQCSAAQCPGPSPPCLGVRGAVVVAQKLPSSDQRAGRSSCQWQYLIVQ